MCCEGSMSEINNSLSRATATHILGTWKRSKAERLTETLIGSGGLPALALAQCHALNCSQEVKHRHKAGNFPDFHAISLSIDLLGSLQARYGNNCIPVARLAVSGSVQPHSCRSRCGPSDAPCEALFIGTSLLLSVYVCPKGVT